MHNLDGIMLGCFICNGSKNFDAELCVDTDFEGELLLPYKMCMDLGLTQKNIDNENILYTDSGTCHYVEFLEKVSLTISMKSSDGDQFQLTDTLSVVSILEQIEVDKIESQPLIDLMTNQNLEVNEVECKPSNKQKVFEVELSPIPLDSNLEGKYPYTQCIFGFLALSRMNLKVDPTKKRLNFIMKKARHI